MLRRDSAVPSYLGKLTTLHLTNLHVAQIKKPREAEAIVKNFQSEPHKKAAEKNKPIEIATSDVSKRASSVVHLSEQTLFYHFS